MKKEVAEEEVVCEDSQTFLNKFRGNQPLKPTSTSEKPKLISETNTGKSKENLLQNGTPKHILKTGNSQAKLEKYKNQYGSNNTPDSTLTKTTSSSNMNKNADLIKEKEMNLITSNPSAASGESRPQESASDAIKKRLNQLRKKP